MKKADPKKVAELQKNALEQKRERLLREELELRARYQEILEKDILGRMVWDPKQWEFITETTPFRGKRRSEPHVKEYMISGLNQGGKSTSLCAKAAYHLTGLYPEGWPGRKWEHPIVAAIGGETASSTRDLLVNRLLGPPEARGSGFIPAHTFDPDKDIVRMPGGVANQVESFRVQHHTGGKPDGHSTVYVFAYSAGWQRLAGYTLHEIWCDEEMDFEIYDEFSARLNATQGHLSISMTPLLGETDLYLLFERAHKEDARRMIVFGINDATHLSAEHRSSLVAKYRNHPMAEARLHGRPVRGKGLIYTVPDEVLLVDDFQIPRHWRQIIGLDFPHTTGKFAAAKLAISPEDVMYLTAEYKEEGLASEIYASRVRAMGGDRIPCAWPHDAGRAHTAGQSVADRYRSLGLNMTQKHAHILTRDGKTSHSVFEVIERLLDRMLSGGFYVFRSCPLFLDEKRRYRHDQGKILPKQEDHLIDAVHKAVLAERFARAPGDRRGSETAQWRKNLKEYDFFG